MMKNISICLLALTALFSCQKEDLDESMASTRSETWQLAKASGGLINVERTGANLPWQEEYVFQGDSTFSKKRTTNGQVEQAAGTYSIRSTAEGKRVTLTYTTNANLVYSCISGNKETLGLQLENATLVSSSQACDGLKLEYTKIR